MTCYCNCCAVKAKRIVDLTEFLNKERRRRSTLSKSSESEQSKSSSSSGDDNIIYPSDLPPEWSVDISSEHNLQLTLTKSSLNILKELQKVVTMHSISISTNLVVTLSTLVILGCYIDNSS